jgi:hypothetical protein
MLSKHNPRSVGLIGLVWKKHAVLTTPGGRWYSKNAGVV